MTFRAAVLAVVLLLLPQGARAQAPAPPVAETVAVPLIETILLPGEVRAWRAPVDAFRAGLGLGEARVTQ
jgi:hypothetical protein